MADTVGASYLIWWPGSFDILSSAPYVYGVGHSSADNASATITTITPVNGGISILLIYANYEAAADTGTLSITGANASIRDQGVIATLAAGTSKIIQTPSEMRFLNADGAVTITLAAGGTLTGDIAVWYVVEGSG